MTKDEQMQKTCCFTGHRRIPADEYETVKLRLRETVIRAIRNGYRYFGTGGSWGFDMLAAQTVLELKEIYPNIYLILVLPCKIQTKYWSDDNKRSMFGSCIRRIRLCGLPRNTQGIVCSSGTDILSITAACASAI